MTFVPPPSEELEAECRELIANSQIIAVRPLSIHCEVIDDSRPPIAVKFDTHLEYGRRDDIYMGRYDFHVELTDGSETQLTELSTRIVVQFRVTNGLEPSESAVDHVTGTVGFMAAYPYARSIIQEELSRVQIGMVVLGMVTPLNLRPTVITLNGVALGFEPLIAAIQQESK